MLFWRPIVASSRTRPFAPTDTPNCPRIVLLGSLLTGSEADWLKLDGTLLPKSMIAAIAYTRESPEKSTGPIRLAEFSVEEFTCEIVNV